MARPLRLVAWLALSAAALACGGSSASKASGRGAGSTSGTGGSAGTGGDAGAGSGSDQGGSAGANGGDAGEGGSSTDASSVTLDGSPIYTRVQRLTVTQWKNAVTDILRLEAPGNLAVDFRGQPLGSADFTNNERLLHVGVAEAIDFEKGSETAAALATGSADALSRLHSGTDRAGFVSALGRRAFRRPLNADEQAKYEAVFALGEELYGAGFAQGAALVIRAMLVSPHFLYRTELGPAGEPLSGYEIASKLSFWLLDTTPDDALLDSAAAGELDSASGVERVARQMLERPRAREVAREFHAQAFRFARYETVEKPGVSAYSASVTAELAEASLLFFDSVFRGNEGLREILTSSRAFVGPGLASLYGVEPPASMEERTLDPSRAGYFMQVPFLLLFSHDEGPGTIGRGIALNSEVLCNRQVAPAAPIPPIPPASPAQTNRERIEELTAGCGDCHRVFVNPLGFAFEGFDGLGRRRELDNGRPVDTSGSYPFSDGTRDFADANELVRILSETAQAHTCYAKKVTGYALQRDMAEADRPLLESLSDVSRDGSTKELMMALVRAPEFRLRAEGLP